LAVLNVVAGEEEEDEEEEAAFFPDGPWLSVEEDPHADSVSAAPTAKTPIPKGRCFGVTFDPILLIECRILSSVRAAVCFDTESSVLAGYVSVGRNVHDMSRFLAAITE